MSLVFIIEDEPIMAECMALAATGATSYPHDRHATVMSAGSAVSTDVTDAVVNNPPSTTPTKVSADPQEDRLRTRIFNDALSAMAGIREELPDVILLDILLTGPDGFTFLNELASYSDTMRIPVALVTNLDLSKHNLEHYGIYQILNKTTMTPEDIRAAVIKGIELSAARPQALEPQVTPLDPQAAPTPQPTAPESSLPGLAKLQSSLSSLPSNPDQTS